MMEGFGHMGFGWIFWIAIIVFVVWFIINQVNRNKSNNAADSALDIVKKRYARGGITKEQFEDMKKNLIK